MGRQPTKPIFVERDGDERLRVGSRYATAVTDELAFSVCHRDGGSRSVVCDRDQVTRLHAALGRWLADGWPGVPHRPGGDARRADEHERRCAAETVRRAIRDVVFAADCAPSGSLVEPDHHTEGCACGRPYICEVGDPTPLIFIADDDHPALFARPVECPPCGARLRLVPNRVPSHPDWEYVDEDGHTWVDRTPDNLRTAEDYARLASENIGAYSLLNAYSDYGLRNPWVHTHRPARCACQDEDRPPTPAQEDAPPECHGMPMWAAPHGWVCRVKNTVWPYEARRIVDVPAVA